MNIRHNGIYDISTVGSHPFAKGTVTAKAYFQVFKWLQQAFGFNSRSNRQYLEDNAFCPRRPNSRGLRGGEGIMSLSKNPS